MGIYDRIIIPHWQADGLLGLDLYDYEHNEYETWWQTKSLMTAMDSYRIGQDNRLYRREPPLDDYPSYGINNKRVREWRFCKFTGSAIITNRFESGRFDYQLDFSRGNLNGIEQTE